MEHLLLQLVLSTFSRRVQKTLTRRVGAIQCDRPNAELFLRCILKTEILYPCPAIVIGNGDTPAVQFTNRHFRSTMRQAHRRFQTIVKYLLDHISHPLTAGVIEQRHPFARHIGNNRNTFAFPSQAIDSGKLISAVQEKNVFSNDRASPIMPQAIRGEISGILHKLAHLILQEDL
jgi:hypothetical protein